MQTKQELEAELATAIAEGSPSTVSAIQKALETAPEAPEAPADPSAEEQAGD